MSNKLRFPLLVSAIAGLLVLSAVLIVTRLYRGTPVLLTTAAFSEGVITPNADGDTDVTAISYTVSRSALVSIYLEHQETGERFWFRERQLRGPGDYRVLFSGVVAGYRLPGDQVEGEIVARLLQNGAYRWVVAAESADHSLPAMQIEGTLTVQGGDTTLPDLRGFSVVPTSFDNSWRGTPDELILFSPNRDGIADRLQIHFDLAKDVAQLQVYLLDGDGIAHQAFEIPRSVPTNKAGLHVYDYAGGVDQGALPPPDGVYPLIALAEDAVGQKVRVERQIEIRYGGVPRAEIVSPVSAPTLQFSSSTVRLCETLFFTLTIANYGTVPLRTTGPEPGTVYDSAANYNTVGWPTESGAWRVAIGYENELKDYPFRWGIGSAETLTRIGDHLYLMPGEQAVITGGIRVTGPMGSRNPQPMWAGLIHEDVEISQFNNRRDPRAITLDLPPPDQIFPCEPGG